MGLAEFERKKDEKINGVIYDMSPSVGYSHCIVNGNIYRIIANGLSKSFPICRTISYYIEAYTLINRSFEFHFMKTV